MYSLIEIMYVLSGFVYWILFIVLIREYNQNHFKNMLFLAFFFGAIGWIIPLYLFWPHRIGNEAMLKIIGISSNLLIPVLTISLSYFLDYTFFDKITLHTQILLIFGGITNGIYIASMDYRGEFIDTIFGQYYTIRFNISIFTQITYALLLFGTFWTYWRFYYLTHKFLKRDLSNPTLQYTRRFIIGIGSGSIIYLILTILKRLLPYYMNGLDYFLMACMYLIIIIQYRKKHVRLYFLPGTIMYAILIYKSGLHLFDYDFTSRKIIKPSELLKSDKNSNNLRSLLYGATTSLNYALKNDVGAVSLDSLTFEDLYISNYSSQHIHWFLIGKKYNRYYPTLIKRIANNIESDYREELKKLSKGMGFSETISNRIKAEFDKLI